jgi:hypothetical protein
MIQMEQTISLINFSWMVIMDYSILPLLIEDFYSIALRTGYNYGRRVGKDKNPQFIDECQAEALFWLAILFDERYWEIMYQGDPVKFVRMNLRSKLTAYWKSRDSLSLTYFKTFRGEVKSHVEFTETSRTYKALNDGYLSTIDIIDDVVETKLDAEILSLYCDNLTVERISEQVKRSPRFVHTVLNCIERAILNYSRGN